MNELRDVSSSPSATTSWSSARDPPALRRDDLVRARRLDTRAGRERRPGRADLPRGHHHARERSRDPWRGLLARGRAATAFRASSSSYARGATVWSVGPPRRERSSEA